MSSTKIIKTYSMTTNQIPGDTNTGLDQLIDYIYDDNGLAGANEAEDIDAGAEAANQMNHIIIEAASTTKALSDGIFDEIDLIAMNQYLQTTYQNDWTNLHGDDEGTSETGFHRIQNDGSNLQYQGENLINTVADGIYHMGFDVVDERFLNEDGNPNATVIQVACWLNQLYFDNSTTNTGLDRITNLVTADAGLAAKIPTSEVEDGANAADDLNHMILSAIENTGVGEDGWISADDLEDMNQWIQSDEVRLATWTDLHGDDERDEETGFHIVQNDGANTRYFGENFVNTVADGIYHLGFQIQNGKFLNEDGDENALLTDVSDWINYFYADPSTTGTGLDKIVDIIKSDARLAKNTNAGDINQGANYADQLNHFIIDAINQTDAMADGWITSMDLEAMNDWIRSDETRLETWVELHGDDEDGEETGYHLVQNDGANTQYFEKNLVNTVADGIYHMGFEIQEGRFLNEDGNDNASLSDVAAWLNYFYKGATLINGTGSGDSIDGDDDAEDIEGNNGNDVINAGGGNDLINGDHGNDNIQGGTGNDILVGGIGNDTMDGGDGSDVYYITGNQAEGYKSFNGFDTYSDTGADSTPDTIDTIKAIGEGNVDIGLTGFGAESGIERIDATGATGEVRLLGNYTKDSLDFRGTLLEGDNILIDGGAGHDTIFGSMEDDRIVGGIGNDTMDGGDGSDVYYITGNQAEGYKSFNGFDTYSDTGADSTPDTIDTIKAIGEGNVDIGLTGFGAESGIERIDATGATGEVRLLGNYTKDSLDFRGTLLEGDNIVMDGGAGHDTIFGSMEDDRIVGGIGNDTMDGGDGSDVYYITGNQAEGYKSFNGFDTYSDTGADSTPDTIDTIKAIGEGNVDIGLTGFGAESGIERIDATGATGEVRLLGNYTKDSLDFRGTLLEGDNIVMDGGAGHDTIFGSMEDDRIVGGIGNDTMDGGDGSDVYYITGNQAEGYKSFNGFDTYSDTGADSTPDTIDTIKAIGEGNVDIGLTGFGAESGIERIDATGATGEVRLLGNYTKDSLDFRGTLLEGDNILIDGGAGHDTIFGNDSNNHILGSSGEDHIYGMEGSDIIDGGEGKDYIVYSSTVFGEGDLEFGGQDIVQNGKGDFIDFDSLIDNLALIQGQILSDLTDDVQVGNAINENNNFAFNGNILKIDLNYDGFFQESDDFGITLTGVNNITYNTSTDCFMLG